MLIIPLEEAKAGMTLAMTVTHPEHPEQELLRRGFVLEDSVLSRMRALGIGNLFVDYPGLDDLDKFLAPHLSSERQALYTKVRSTFKDCQAASTPTVEFADYYASTRDFITTLLSNGRNPIYLDELSTSLGADGVRHSMAVAHLALVIGIKLEHYLITERRRLTAAQAREVVNLGIAGMLHDIGKTRLDPALQALHALSPDPGDARRGEWESHVRRGYDMIHDEVEATAAAAVLHHHQHFDGSGFPQRDVGNGVKVSQDGSRIHVFARILQAADLYERLAPSHDGKTRRGNLEILHRMRTGHANRIDPIILAMLPKVVPPFPPGGQVTLSDGRRAIVTAIDPEAPYRPTVRVLEADGWTLTGTVLPLVQYQDLGIAKVGSLAAGDMIPRRAARGAGAAAAA